MRLRYFHTSNHPLILDLYQQAFLDLEACLGPNWFRRNEYRKKLALKNLLVNLVMCQGRYYQEVSISRWKGTYKIDRRYRALHFKYEIYIPLVDALIETGWISQKIGFQDSKTGKSFQTRLMPTNKVKRGGNILPIYFFDECPEVIELRDSCKQSIGYQETRAITRMRDRLDRYNNYLKEHQIALSYPSNRAIEEQENPNRPHYLSNISVTPCNSSIMLAANPSSRRVFNQSFSRGGRFYNPVQNLSQKERATITIDGQSTQELDYRTLHPTMLYHKEGLQAPSDCYAVFSRDSLNGELRPVIKLLVLIMLNAGTLQKALRAFQSKWNELHGKDPFQQHPSLVELLSERNLELSDVVSQIQNFHSPIDKYFNSGIGIHLQNWDAQIIEKVLVACTKKKVPVIPIHDSIIGPASEQDFLEEQLSRTYKEKFGQSIRIEPKCVC